MKASTVTVKLGSCFHLFPFIFSFIVALSWLTPNAIAQTKKDELFPGLLKELPLGLKSYKTAAASKEQIDIYNSPQDNPTTIEKVKLGRELFFDNILSGNEKVSCASCHDSTKMFAGPGSFTNPTKRKVPSLINRAFAKSMFWDGRVATLEEQALLPIEDPDEMNAKLDVVLDRLKKSEQYQTLFKAAFAAEDQSISRSNLAKALAAYQRSLLVGNSPVDRFMQNGERSILTSEQIHGFWLYESKGLCWKCHTGANFTDESFHNTGVSWGQADLGRFSSTKKEEDRGKFKTPTLRGVAKSGPYMHDSSIKTLEDVVEFYNKGGVKNANLDLALKPLNLSDDEKKSIVAFLKALSE